MTRERTELEKRYTAFAKHPFPSEWNRITDRFGDAWEREEVRSEPGFERLSDVWGGPDLILYDTYVAGHVDTILRSGESGAVVIGEVESDWRIERYLDVCLREAKDEETRRAIEVCREFLAGINELLEVARHVPRR